MTSNVKSPVAKDWIVFADGRFIRLSEATFFANTQALNYGTGVFEGIRAYWDHDHRQLNMLRVEDHYNRLISSAAILRFKLEYSCDDLVRITQDLLHRNDFREDVYIRPLLVKKSLMPGEKFGVKLRGVDSSLCITALPMGAYAKSDRFRCVVSKWQRVSNAAIPSEAKITGTYVNSALAYEDALDHGADDAIMLNERGKCAEATTSNVFVVKKGTVLTPPPSTGILKGVTRASVIEMCALLEIDCREETLDSTDLYGADQCFLTGTGIEIKVVYAIDDRIYAGDDDTIAGKIFNLYRDIVRGRSEDFASWLTPVY